MNGGSTAQKFAATVQGQLTKATELGFPSPQEAVRQLTDFVNGFISAFMNVITSVCNAIVNFVGGVVNFVLTVWDKIAIFRI